MNNGFAVMIEGTVGFLLAVTIAYLLVLNRRLKRLRADEHTLKATISELITATEIAERAIAGLKVTVRDCNQTLGERLVAGQSLSADLDRKIGAGESVVSRIAQITAVARPIEHLAPLPPIATEAQATVVAAQAFAARQRERTGFAA